jgi:hypothetical protein
MAVHCSAIRRLPQSAGKSWDSAIVNGSVLPEALLRILSASAPISPAASPVARAGNRCGDRSGDHEPQTDSATVVPTAAKLG